MSILNASQFALMFLNVVVIVLLFVVARVLRRRGPWGASCVVAVAWFMVFRFALFGNPAAWYTYYLLLDRQTTDWREVDVVALEVKKYFRDPELKYLAVGSSQTWAVYSQYSKLHPELGRFYLAGMTPADMVLYQDRIVDQHPKNVLLFLSEFDLARDLQFLAMPTAPTGGTTLWHFIRDLNETAPGVDARATSVRLILGDIFPEIRYSFVFRDLLHSYLIGAGNAKLGQAQSADISFQINQLKDLHQKNIGPMTFFLEHFIDHLMRNGINVVIVEGQYNPAAYTDDNLLFNQHVIEPYLLSLREKFPDVKVYLRRNVMQFNKSDYMDGYHVKSDAGYEFSEKIVSMLDRNNPADRKQSSGL